ncbi:MAG: MoaD/ThiS family protein [Ignavibacteriaceae bacterium]|jgi:sulfur-carrier protein
MIDSKAKRVQICYFAALRELRGISEETIDTSAVTAEQLYDELASLHNFNFNKQQIKVAINDSFVQWDTALSPKDIVVFIPPVAGG